MVTSKYIEIKMPASADDLRIHHIDALTNKRFKKANLSLEDIIALLSIISSATQNELKKVNISELQNLYLHCLRLFSECELKEPQQEIEIQGVKYELVNPRKVGIGWHIDIANSDFEKEPSRLASLMYIEKGTNYGDTDQNGNMLYSNQDRQKIFEKHLPLPIYLNLVSFFLRQSLVLMKNYTEPQKKKKKINLLKNLLALRGKKLFTF